MIFGTLLTGNNFNDNDKKTTGGRNGLGAKLANIFSKEFTVQCCDASRGKKFKQTFYNNLAKRDEASITPYSAKASSTKISFKPDLSRFHMGELDDDILALMRRRVYDVAGTNPDVKVSLNGDVIPIKSFKDYCNLFTANLPVNPLISVKTPWAYFKAERWEVCLGVSPEGEFRQMSFVNSIATTKGGTHVKYRFP